MAQLSEVAISEIPRLLLIAGQIESYLVAQCRRQNHCLSFYFSHDGAHISDNIDYHGSSVLLKS